MHIMFGDFIALVIIKAIGCKVIGRCETRLSRGLAKKGLGEEEKERLIEECSLLENSFF